LLRAGAADAASSVISFWRMSEKMVVAGIDKGKNKRYLRVAVKNLRSK
jgi:hypothetical protein